MKYEASLTVLHTSYPAYENGTDRVFRNVGIQQSDAGEIPIRIQTRLKTRQKFEIKNTEPYLAMFKMRCGIPNAYNLDITMYKMHVSVCS